MFPKTFQPSISKSHLGRNPLICNCKLKWLNDFLQTKPVEKSGITCRYPKRLAKKSIGSLPSQSLRCSKRFLKRNAEHNACGHLMCPSECKCNGTIVDCRNRQLTTLPTNMPTYATQM